MKHSPVVSLLARLALVGAMLGVSGCASLLGGGKPAAIYSPMPKVQANAAWPSVPWQLLVTTSSASAFTDSQRIAVRPAPSELQVYKGATWARRPTDMLEDALLRTLEQSGRIPAVARPGSGINADYRLVLDLRRFESEYAGAAAPSAVIEVSAKLLHAQDERVVASRTFLQSQPAAGTDVAQVVAAFEQSLSDAGRDIAAWTLAAGSAHAATERR